ncbi:MAG: GHKL domain-containing protein [Lachnospiraceae bacterium]|nr:GHKL domain-containing protein [Lachnospiraceae bacterium]
MRDVVIIGSLVCIILCLVWHGRKRKKQQMERSREIESEILQMKQDIRQVNAICHEIKNSIWVMNLLYKDKEYDQLGEYLAKVGRDSAKLHYRQYSRHFLLNMLLRGYASRMETAGVRFTAAAVVPEALGMEEKDLISFLCNLLNNALEGSSRVSEPGERYCTLKIELKEMYLTISCENSYAGYIHKMGKKKIISSKNNGLFHGYGIQRMSQIVKKYHSILDISYTDTVFSVKTALKMS